MKRLWELYHDEIPDFLMEFMNLDIMKRIQKVGMNCGCEYTQFELFCGLKPYTRYDHSVGCALILWHFTNDRAQTLAGLFHDAASPAFSHVIDFLHEDHLKQESTEEKTEEILLSSDELNMLLNQSGLSFAQISDYHMYPIADNDTPQLSADRLEYTLSNLYNYGLCSLEEIRGFYDDLSIGVNEYGEHELCFIHEDVAEKFALCALKTAGIYVADEDRFIMQILADIMKWAIERHLLSEEDLYVDEQHVISKLLQDETSALMWRQFMSLNSVERTQNKPQTGLFRKVDAKKRWINPMVETGVRVRDFSEEFRVKSDEFLAQSFDVYLKTDCTIDHL